MLILGPPGTGKSYNVTILAAALIAVTDDAILYTMKQNVPLSNIAMEFLETFGSSAVCVCRRAFAYFIYVVSPCRA